MLRPILRRRAPADLANLEMRFGNRAAPFHSRRGSWRDAWGHCPARGDGGKVGEEGTGRYRSGKPKSKNEADGFHPDFILVKE